MVQEVRVTYIALRLYFGPPIQEEGDGGILAIPSSAMEGGPSILPQGHTHRQTDRQTDIDQEH